jgi:hypothetical protein
MNGEVAKLWLNSNILTVTDSSYGNVSADYRTMNFNINMRTVLGNSLMDNYPKFKMYLWERNTYDASASNITFISGLNIQQSGIQGIGLTGSLAAVGVNGNSKRNIVREFIITKPLQDNITVKIENLNYNGTTSTLYPAQYFMTFVPVTSSLYKNPFASLFNHEVGKFTLSTSTLSKGATNQFGTMNAYRSSFTFSNVNLSNVLSASYTKYNLVIMSVATGPASNIVLQNHQKQLFFTLTGLPFTNATATGIVSNIATVPVGYIDNFATGYSSVCDAPVNITTFTKPSSNTVELTFNLYTGDGSTTNSSNVYGEWSFTFGVIGIKV